MLAFRSSLESVLVPSAAALAATDSKSWVVVRSGCLGAAILTRELRQVIHLAKREN
jgi:hypothetical protein